MRALFDSSAWVLGGALGLGLVASSFAVAAGGCSSGDSSDAGSTSGAGGAPSTALVVPAPGDGFQLAFQHTVSAGSEVHVCREFVVPGEGDVNIDRFETEVPEGTHHVLAYHTPKTAAEVTDDVFDCGDVPGQIFYEQSADGAGARFPEGVGVKLQGGEVVRLELHFLDIGATDMQPELKLDAWYAKKPLVAEAGSFFMYDRDIALPAHQSFTARMHCEVPEDITIVDILPHVHVRGVAQRMFLGGGGLAERQLFLSTTGYQDQETRRFDDGFVVHAGQFLDFECDYDNTTDEDVIEGPSKEHNEMCMLLGDYYPRMEKAAEWCTLEGSGPVLDGTSTCAEAFTALTDGQNTDFASEEVIVNVCAKANRAWNDLGNCGFNACSDLCPGPECNACAAQHCLTEFGACQAASCD